MLTLIQNLITPLIIILAVILLIVILYNYTVLKDHFSTIYHALNGREVKKTLDAKGNITEYER